MWRRIICRRQLCRYSSTSSSKAPSRNVIEIDNGTFYKAYPAEKGVDAKHNPKLFPQLSFSLPTSHNEHSDPQFWSVISTSSLARTTFLQILAGQHICIPPTARSYPYLSDQSTSAHHAIKYVGFDAERGSSVGGTNVRGAYLSARYESRREETDFSVHDYLTGNTELNALERVEDEFDSRALQEIVKRLNLTSLLHMPVSNLSNGQTRRARIAKALMARPEVLLLDGPFMGLDPRTLANMARLLHQLAQEQSPRLILSLRPEDGIPEWISHLVIADESLNVLAQGRKSDILNNQSKSTADSTLRSVIQAAEQDHDSVAATKLSRDGFPQESPALPAGEALVEMRGVKVSYGEKTVLGDWTRAVDGENQSGLWWNLRRGQRCGIFGANGSGKTTMLSLITSDHPQTYSLPIKLFGRSRLPGPGEPGISVFDIQRRMGHSSPEVHAFFPRQLTVRRALETAWADTPMSRPTLDDHATRRVNAFLRWFARELNPRQIDATVLEDLEKVGKASRGDLESANKAYNENIPGTADVDWAKEVRFRELGFSSQRLLLFLRALVASPDLVILDEALSGVDENVRDKALLFLSHGESVNRVIGDVVEPSILSKLGKTGFQGLSSGQALLVISHAKEDVPGCVREWICLPEPGDGRPPRVGTLQGPLELNRQGWDQIWGKST